MLTIDGVEMLDVREAAALAHRSPETIRRWVWSGRISSVKHGNKLLVARVDIAAGASMTETPALSLEEWAGRVAEVSTGSPGSGISASDLIYDDRAARAGR